MRKLAVFGLAIAAVLVVGACNSGGGLTGKTWQLTAITEQVPAFQGVVPEADQSRYTITFNTDGTYNAQADCNALNGTYTTTGTGGMTIVLGPMTMAACPEDSMSNQFVAALGNAESYAIADGQLSITDTTGGTLQFN
jgi:heat shock protein HslJ